MIQHMFVQVGSVPVVYYQMAGWEGGGTPTVAKLAEFDLLWANHN